LLLSFSQFTTVSVETPQHVGRFPLQEANLQTPLLEVRAKGLRILGNNPLLSGL
jgi:hypothetical protein